MFASKDTLLTRPSGGYNIARSVRTRASASGNFTRTLSTPTDSTKFTFSAWIKRGSLSSSQGIFQAGNTNYIQFGSGDTIQLVLSNTTQLTTTAVFRDPSAWGHLVFSYNNAVSPKWNFYYNNVNIGTSTASNTTLNTATAHGIANPPSGGGYFDGYLTEINFIDGQALTPSLFGSTNALTGVWQPAKYTGTYGTNGFYLNFSSNGSSAALGTDFSGNTNTWTVNNISVTAGATYDSMVDSPTTSSVSSNYCVLNPLEKYSGLTIADGNLKVTASDNTQYGAAGTLAISSGKWYYEAIFSNASVNNQAMGFVTTNNNVQTAQWAGSTGMFMCGNFVSGTAIHVGVNGSYTQVSTTLPSAGSYLVCAVDYDNGKAWFGTTTSSGGAVTYYPASTGGSVGDPAAGTNPTITFSTTYPVRPFMGSYGSGANWIANFGQRPFITTAPTGYNAWNTYNLPDSTIKNGAGYMAATTYTGTGAAQSISNAVNGVSFQPDFIWFKSRAQAYNNVLYDSVRGRSKALVSNTTDAEDGNATSTQDLTSFNSNGFSLGTVYFNSPNNSISNPVAWQWKAGGTSSSNTNGSITSTVSAGATQGFSVVTYTATNAAGTIGHGLGVAPSLIITKNRSDTGGRNWGVYHASVGATKFLQLNTTSASQTGTAWNDTAPTSTVFSVGGGSFGETNYPSGNTYVAYCFAAVKGFSAFGSYTGNGSTDGTFVYTGFRPRFVMVKNTTNSGGATNWTIQDSSRNGYNPNKTLYANASSAEDSSAYFDLLSNGFKVRDTFRDVNTSGDTYIYAAFAENPFKNALAR